jgi:GcrA cell cycle regulator
LAIGAGADGPIGAHHKADSMEPSNWPSERCDALREYFVKGMSYSEIAKAINARFGTSYTRNAVLGRGKRMGLVAPERIDSPPIVPPLPTGPRPPRPREYSSLEFSRPPKSALARAEPVQLRCVGIRPRLISLVELEPSDCRYPYGGDKEGGEIAFCGHPRQPGSSYCAPHFRLTRASGTVSERAAGPVMLRLVAGS